MPNNNPFPIVSSASEILNLISNLPTETLDLLHNVVNKEEFEENTKRRTVAYTQVREDSAICLTYKLPLEASYARSLLIFLDIDDTLITPKSITFREPPYNQMIDRIKANKSNYDNCEEIISNWRLQRKVMLIDKEWAQVLNTLREKFSVFALTQMNTGQFGNIASMQEWRYEELKSLGIEFSDNEKLEIYNSGKKDDAVFYRGIFITGNHSKSGTLAKFSQDLNARFIVFVDDREKHLEDIQNYCEKNNIGFLGILFDGLKKLKDEPDPKLAEFQESYLIENAKWLEDAEAYKMMAENKELG